VEAKPAPMIADPPKTCTKYAKKWGHTSFWYIFYINARRDTTHNKSTNNWLGTICCPTNRLSPSHQRHQQRKQLDIGPPLPKRQQLFFKKRHHHFNVNNNTQNRFILPQPNGTGQCRYSRRWQQSPTNNVWHIFYDDNSIRLNSFSVSTENVYLF
jgi:hypothetical protein